MTDIEEIRIGIIDDDELFCETMSMLISKSERFVVEFYVTNSEDLKEELLVKKIDILICDLKLKEENGIDLCKSIKQIYQDLKLIGLSSYYKPAFTVSMINHGFNAFLSKNLEKKGIYHALIQVFENGFYFNKEDYQAIKLAVENQTISVSMDCDIRNDLTEIDKQILLLIGEQMTCERISYTLGLSYAVFKKQFAGLLKKLKANSMFDLFLAGMCCGIVDENKALKGCESY